MKKATKAEAKKVATAVKRRCWANSEDLPIVAENDYFFNRGSEQEVHWEGGDFEWTINFASFYNSIQDAVWVEPYNGFVLCVWKR